MIAKAFGRVLRTGLSSLWDRAAARLAALRFNPSRWTEGDALISDDGAFWVVVRSPDNFPGNLTVNRVWGADGIIYDTPAGHCYPLSDPLWKAFRRT